MTNPQQRLTHPSVARRVQQLRRLQEPEALREALASLSYRERHVLELRYGLNGEPVRSLDEIGRTFNITRERARQIEMRAFETVVARVEDVAKAREALRWLVADHERRLRELERRLVADHERRLAAPAQNGGVPLEELELDVRSYNCLRRAGITTVDKLVLQSAPALKGIPNFGETSLGRVTEALEVRGLKLAEDPPRPGFGWWEG